MMQASTPKKQTDMQPASAAKAPQAGEPAPWFTARSTTNPTFHFDTVAGRYIVLCFFGSSADAQGRAALDWMQQEAARFDDANLAFFGVSTDVDDERLARVCDRIPGIRFFWDFDRSVCRTYGLLQTAAGAEGVARTTFVLDPLLRVLAIAPFTHDMAQHTATLNEILRQLPLIPPSAPAAVQAPVLVAPRIFEPALCRRLIEAFNADGGRDSGFMRDVGGRTVALIDHKHKRRCDHTVTDERLKQACLNRIHHRLAPQIKHAFQFHATWMERYVVACYDSAWSGHFRPHRDNTTKGTAHRRFAVTINLNTGDYDGGCLRFPEFGSQLYSAPPGGAVVFSCSLLHEATPVTRGKRYAFLPFLYDDAAADVRRSNLKFLEG